MDLTQPLPPRLRLALGLASARRVLDRLDAHPTHRKSAALALEAGWRWILRPAVELADVEEQLEPRLYVRLFGPPHSAMQAVATALHLLYDCAKYPAAIFQDPPPPTLLKTILDLALDAAGDRAAERAWQEQTLRHLQVLSRESAEVLGPIVRPSDFGFPGDDLDEQREARRAKTEDVRPLRLGDTVHGVVRSFLPDRAVVAIGDTDDLAYLPLHEISDPPPASPQAALTVKQPITAVVVRAPVGGGFALLSLKRGPPG